MTEFGFETNGYSFMGFVDSNHSDVMELKVPKMSGGQIETWGLIGVHITSKHYCYKLTFVNPRDVL
eukprot:SAG31_NODE_4283_length_3381_cov_2.101767_3_plen_66_part_00